MRINPSLQLIVALIACALLPASVQANTTAQPRMLVLRQNSMAYGPLIVDVQKNGIRMDTADHEKTILCAGPTWDAYLFNNKHKLLYKRPYSVWVKDGVLTALSLEWNDFDQKAVHTGELNYAGLSAAEYAFPSSHNGVSNIRFGKIADYVTTNAVEIDPKIGKFVSSLFDCPLSKMGLLMRFRRIAGRTYGFGLKYNRQDYIETCLQTTNSTYAPLDQKLFLAPTDYKPASDGAIFVDQSDSNEAFKELIHP
ncbi:MAG TPA: hypothetical protein V6C81_25130 [Planktothrix sp.]|jgi:hypothetical protein